MSIYSCGVYGHPKVGDVVTYIYGLNMYFDRVSDSVIGKKFSKKDFNEISFNPKRNYRSGHGKIIKMERRTWGYEDHENEKFIFTIEGCDEEIDSCMFMVVAKDGIREFEDSINSYIYPIDNLKKAIDLLETYRNNILEFAVVELLKK